MVHRAIRITNETLLMFCLCFLESIDYEGKKLFAQFPNGYCRNFFQPMSTTGVRYKLVQVSGRARISMNFQPIKNYVLVPLAHWPHKLFPSGQLLI